LTPRSEKFLVIVDKAEEAYSKENKMHEELAKNQALFDNIEKLQEQEEILIDINVSGLISEIPEKADDLLVKEARVYEASISKSKDVLKRYASIASLEEKKEEQDQWVRIQLREIENQEDQLTQFHKLLTESTSNSLFVQTLSSQKQLTDAQLAALVYLRHVTILKPNAIAEGARYTESNDIIQKLEITAEEKNKGWWIKTGMLNEYIPPTSLLLPDFSTAKLSNVDQLKMYLSGQLEQLKQKKDRYIDLQKGIVPEGFSEYDYDRDLSDNTRLEMHKTAVYYCGLLEDKISLIKTQKRKEASKIEEAKKQYGIADQEIDYVPLLQKITDRKEHFRMRHVKFNDAYTREQKEISTLTASIPTLEDQHVKLIKELDDAKREVDQSKQIYETKYFDKPIENEDAEGSDIAYLTTSFQKVSGEYISLYNQVIGKYEETKDSKDFRVAEQVMNQNYNFEILEDALLGPKIKTLDGVTAHLDQLNTDLLSIADELMKNITKVFGKTEEQFDKYKALVGDLNDFFRGKRISERFYFRIDFNPAPKLDIKWIEHLRKSAQSIAANGNLNDTDPRQFIEGFYATYSGNKRVYLLKIC
jgi:exonuclease SbcC